MVATGPKAPYDRSMSKPQYVIQERTLKETSSSRRYYIWKAHGEPYATKEDAMAALRKMLGVGEHDTIEEDEIADAGFRLHVPGQD